jgi:hypothetical protein
MLSRVAVGIVTSLAVFGAIQTPGMALEPASTYQISNPVTHENLSVYFVRGQGTQAPVPLTLDEAMATGSAKVHVRREGSTSHLVDNFSDRSIFIPAGTLLIGGLQDQVVATSTIVPPGAINTVLTVFCVDRGRSSARSGDDSASFTVAGTLQPSNLAKLIMASGSDRDSDWRQVGVWLSTRSVIDRISRRLSASVASAPWPTSVPLALEDARVARAQSIYVEHVAQLPVGDDVIGAVFSVNGRLSGGEIYSSNELFRRVWPKLLRGYATEALAQETIGSEPAPSIATVASFLAGAEQGGAQDTRLFAGAGLRRRASDAALYSVVAQADGRFVDRSYLARADASQLPVTREGTVLQMLKTGLFPTVPFFFPANWDDYFRLVDRFFQAKELGAAHLEQSRPTDVSDHRIGVLLNGLRLDRRAAYVRPAPTNEPANLGSSRDDSDSFVAFNFGLLFIVGLLMCFGALLRRYRSCMPKPVRHQEAVAMPAAPPFDPLSAPGRRRPTSTHTDPGTGYRELDQDCPAADSMLALLCGWAQLGYRTLRQSGYAFGCAMSSRAANRDSASLPLRVSVRSARR